MLVWAAPLLTKLISPGHLRTPKQKNIRTNRQTNNQNPHHLRRKCTHLDVRALPTLPSRRRVWRDDAQSAWLEALTQLARLTRQGTPLHTHGIAHAYVTLGPTHHLRRARLRSLTCTSSPANAIT